MEYIEEIKRLGGLIPLNIEEISTFSIEEVSQLEFYLDKKMPEDYKHFIKKYGVSSFSKEVFFKGLKKDSEYIHNYETGIPNYTFESSVVSVFFGKDDDVYSIYENLDTYDDRKPKYLLPILTDGLGNFVGLHLSEEHYGKIYFWDHETEWDEEDYLEEVGMPMPEKVKYQNLWLIANSFTEFFKVLYLEA